MIRIWTSRDWGRATMIECRGSGDERRGQGCHLQVWGRVMGVEASRFRREVEVKVGAGLILFVER